MKRTHFLNKGRMSGWPRLADIKPFFFAPKGEEWYASTGNDSGSVSLEGVDGTDHLEFAGGRVDINLLLWGSPGLGVLLIYEKIGAPGGFGYVSKGDMSHLGEYVRSTHDTPLPVAYFVPFPEAWNAVKEFMETEGQLPKSIEWVAGKDLPANTFPDP